MYEGQQLRYGHVRGGEEGFISTVAATQYIAAASGKFVKRSGANTDTMTIAGATDTEILGFMQVEARNSSDGTEVRKVINDKTAVFRIPVSAGTFVEYMKGKTCDLRVSAGIQGAVLNSNNLGVLIIEAGDAVGNSWVDVRLNHVVTEAKAVKTGVV